LPPARLDSVTTIAAVRELQSGLWHWQAPHREWESRAPYIEEVSSCAIDDGTHLLLFDPLAVPTEILDLASERAAGDRPHRGTNATRVSSSSGCERRCTHRGPTQPRT
jgi:hypothetical protein